MVGLRANGQGLDLNRDHIKAETPEFNAILQHVYNAWDPDVMMDLHTTDGTRHGYGLTYAPPLNPNTDDAVELYTRDVMMPAIRKELRDKFKLETFDYGNVEKRGNVSAWYEVGPEGRYSTNYVGLRNRIGILSEALTYLSFKNRVLATERFTDAVLRWTANHAKEVVSKTKAADQTTVQWGLDPPTAPQLGVRFDWKSRGIEGLLIEKTTAKKEGVPTDLETVKMPVYDRFVATRSSEFPAAYVFPASEVSAARLLVKHGVVVDRFAQNWAGQVMTFDIKEHFQDAQAFQGHKLQRLEGVFRPTAISMTAGDFVVRTAQPLGVLAFHLLEPESIDGAMAWGLFGEAFTVGQTYPVHKVMKPMTAVTERTTSP